jgi:hypothetical protein
LNGQRYIVTLEAPHWGDEADGIRRLRAMLKRLGRGYGLHCIEVRTDEPFDPDGAPAAEPQPTSDEAALAETSKTPYF